VKKRRHSGKPGKRRERAEQQPKRADRKKPEQHRPGGRPASARPVRLPAGCPPHVIRFVDAQIVVVDKPAGLTTMRHPEEAAEFGSRAQRFLPPTLADILPQLLKSQGKPPAGPTKVIPVHRLDKETSGLVVFARTPEAARHLGEQFRRHTTERRYAALVRGQAQPSRIESRLVRDRGDGRRGSGTAKDGQRAVTHVRGIEQFPDYALVECRLETGRTHQVRIHLGEAGTPLCGERLYDRPLHGAPLPDGSRAKRPMLHAAFLGFDHPAMGKRMTWEAALPKDMQDLLERLRNGKSDRGN
jgi:23S rRNA pseudouridine1911/1915/1917 synthase